VRVLQVYLANSCLLPAPNKHLSPQAPATSAAAAAAAASHACIRPISDWSALFKSTHPMIVIGPTKVPHFLLLVYGLLRKSCYSIREMWPFHYYLYLNIPIFKSILFNPSATFVSLTWYIWNDVRHFLKTVAAVSVIYLLCHTAHMSEPFINVSTAIFLRGFICEHP
jgi:hypothetical protein